MTTSWEAFEARCRAREQAIEAMRSKSPLLWLLRHRIMPALRAAVRWVSQAPIGYVRALPQRIRQGFWDRETWSLDSTVAQFMLPRLRRLRTLQCGHPCDVTWDEWQWILHEVEWFLEFHVDSWNRDYSNDSNQRYERAGQLFGKYFGALWD